METARLLLRPPEEADLDDLVALDGFPEVRRSIDPFADRIPADPVSLRQYERGFVANDGFFGAIERASGRLVGWFQCQRSADAPGELELGYRLRPDVWGRGYASEGARVVLADALARPGITRVYAHGLLNDPASLRGMEKIGMTYARPWAYRGLLGAEYEARGPR